MNLNQCWRSSHQTYHRLWNVTYWISDFTKDSQVLLPHMSILKALGEKKKSGLQNRNLYSKIGSISFCGLLRRRFTMAEILNFVQKVWGIFPSKAAKIWYNNHTTFHQILIITNYNQKQNFTECPTDMLTTSDSILKFLKPHISKNKPCFEILVNKSFKWHLET